VTGERLEYYADFGDIRHIAKTITDAYIYDGIYSPHRKKMFGTPVGDRKGDQFVVFIQNHDQTGNRMLGERLNELVEFEVMKLLAGTMFYSPFVPLLFMGEEYGETNPFLYFNSHSDPDLIKMVRKGRKNEFRDFFSKGEPADPQDIQTFERSKLSWNYQKNQKRRSMLDYYKTWIRLKKVHPVLKENNRKNVEVQQPDNGNILIVTRFIPGKRLSAILNFEKNAELVKLPAGKIKDVVILIYSASSQWNGPVKMSPDRISIDDGIIVSGHSIMVIEYSE
jgi:maltooligosyltrehalose trehalohydrolase